MIVAGFFLMTYVASRGRVLGFGDVILAVSIGMLLGPLDGLFAVWVACVVGSCVGVYQILGDASYRTSSMRSLVRHHVPFGPFLLIGFMVVFLHGLTFDMLMSGIAPDIYL
jgi:prepilin signal peptidase PulO-like enzyme (type II secretory pathway)